LDCFRKRKPKVFLIELPSVQGRARNPAGPFLGLPPSVPRETNKAPGLFIAAAQKTRLRFAFFVLSSLPVTRPTFLFFAVSLNPSTLCLRAFLLWALGAKNPGVRVCRSVFLDRSKNHGPVVFSPRGSLSLVVKARSWRGVENPTNKIGQSRSDQKSSPYPRPGPFRLSNFAKMALFFKKRERGRPLRAACQ